VPIRTYFLTSLSLNERVNDPTQLQVREDHFNCTDGETEAQSSLVTSTDPPNRSGKNQNLSLKSSDSPSSASCLRSPYPGPSGDSRLSGCV
jgi:hypothetical protein